MSKKKLLFFSNQSTDNPIINQITPTDIISNQIIPAPIFKLFAYFKYIQFC